MLSFGGLMSSHSSRKLGLLSGGHRSEHDISLRSASSMRKALEASGFSIEEFIIACDGSWNALAAENQRPTHVESSFEVAAWRGTAAEAVLRWAALGVDCVVLALHGKSGEDGSMQGFLQQHGFAYTGCGVQASALAMNKILTKRILQAEGIQTPPWRVVPPTAPRDVAQVEAWASALGWPLVLKAPGLGSYVGVFIVRSPDEALSALADLGTREDVLVEGYLSGREFSVPVLGSGPQCRALPTISIVPKLGKFFDLESKYTPGGAEETCPAPVADSINQELMRLAVQTHRAVGATGLTRTDILEGSDGSLQVIEINTLPGMTEQSLVPRSALVAGMSMGQLMQALVQDAYEQCARRNS